MPKGSVLEGHLTSSDGLRLSYRERRLGDGSPHVLLVHGVAEHGGRYRWVEDFLAGHGVGLSIMDLRGHGRSGGRRVWAPSFESYLGDLDLLFERARSHCDRPFLAGHSLGGLIVVRYAETRRPGIRGLITSGAALKPSVVPPAPVVWVLRALNAVSTATPIPGLVAPSRLSRDPEVVRRYVEDPMVPRHLTTGLGLAGLEAGRVAVAEAHRIHAPALLLHGGDDAVVDPEGSRQLFARLPTEDKRLEVYPGLFHELFNEPEKESVLGDLVAWVKGRAG